MQQIFISHTSADDAFVKSLREKLEAYQLKVWVDSRNLRSGQKLAPEIEAAIQASSYMIAVLSPKTINSPWVRKEIAIAEAAHIPVIPLMLQGIEPSALSMWFSEEPVGVKIQLELGQLQAAMPQILAALGERLSDDLPSESVIEHKPLCELILELSEPELTGEAEQTQLSARARLIYSPTNPAEPKIESPSFKFFAPQLDLTELTWYLEKYFTWPVGLFRERAKDLENRLPQWGQALFEASLAKPVCQKVLQAWQNTRHEVERRISIQISSEPLEPEQQAATHLAASRLQALPWELLRDATAYVSEGANPIRVRRRLPNYEHKAAVLLSLPIRILLISSRPEDERASYIDHRASALPLVDAVEHLGELIELSVLTPATKGALERELQRAQEASTAYHVVHFDGHGVYDVQHGSGALCFEHPEDSVLTEKRRMQLVYADELGAILRDYRIPLVFLEACQTAQANQNPNASVAATLLQTGITSVVAMTHSVLVETSRRFVTDFYQALAQGKRVGAAMLAGQQALMRNTFRLPLAGAGDVYMQDWFVPILYQEQVDPALFQRLPSTTAQRLGAEQRQTKLGHLPATPEHTFIGRSRELLKLERLLEQQPYVVIRGQGGAGKTTVAVELARWLVRSQCFDRTAFVSVEQFTHVNAIAESLLHQLVSKHENLAAEYKNDVQLALKAIRRTLENERTVIVIDNMESLLADEENVAEVLGWLQKLLFPSSPTLLLQGAKGVKLIFTSRECLPEPFNHAARYLELGELSIDDARQLVLKIMHDEGLALRHDDKGNTPEQVEALIKTVGCHARALVLVARELARSGNAIATTDRVQQIMQDLYARYPNSRERSLFASVELSLQRLSTEVREQIQGLTVFRDGGNTWLLSVVLGLSNEEMTMTVANLIKVGLAGLVSNTSYIRLDPALTTYLSLSLNAEQYSVYHQRWLNALEQFLGFLYRQSIKDSILSAQLTQVELPNLIAYLKSLLQSLEQGLVEAESVDNQLGCMEQLLNNTNELQALKCIRLWREQIGFYLEGWCHARFERERLSIEQFLQDGALPKALDAALSLLSQCKHTGLEAYQGANYDLAMANALLGRAWKDSGFPIKALPYLQVAQQGFEQSGDIGAMVSGVLIEQADCFSDLGQLDKAVALYKSAIKRDERLKNKHSLAVGKGQLASIYLKQGRYSETLKIAYESKQLFEQLNNIRSVAVAWFLIAKAYSFQQDFQEAEHAYRQSLKLDNQHSNRAGEANCLGELGCLYDEWGKFEQALNCYQRAFEIDFDLGNLYGQVTTRNDIAVTLFKLGHYDQARYELHRAVEDGKAFGHLVKPWITWNLLYKVEHASGHADAARKARLRAVQNYLAYRHDGGENYSIFSQFCLRIFESIQQKDIEVVVQDIKRALNSPYENTILLKNLQAILAGGRDLKLADDESFDYEIIGEITFLLERLREADI